MCYHTPWGRIQESERNKEKKKRGTEEDVEEVRIVSEKDHEI